MKCASKRARLRTSRCVEEDPFPCLLQAYDPLADRADPGGAAVRRVPGRHRLPRHHLHRAARACPTPARRSGPTGMGSCPGGIANLAIATSRLGLRTSLAAAFGDDDYGDFCWRTLEEQEASTCRSSRRFEHWHSPVTVSMAVDRDRSMVTHGHPPPMPAAEMIGAAAALPGRDRDALRRRAARRARRLAQLGRAGARATARSSSPTSAGTRRAPGRARCSTSFRLPRLHAQRDRGDGLHPHRHPARRAVRARRPGAARRGHRRGQRRHGHRLHDRRGGVRARAAGDGARPDRRRRRLRRRPRARHPVRAGRWPTGWRSPALCAALAVQQFGGSLAAPGWGDIADWWHDVRERRPTTAAPTPSSLAAPLRLPRPAGARPSRSGAVRRAAATIARLRRRRWDHRPEGGRDPAGRTPEPTARPEHASRDRAEGVPP